MLLVHAAKILPPSRHDEAVRLLDAVLSSLKAWESEDRADWHQRNTAAALRNDALAVYAVIDPGRAISAQKQFESTSRSDADGRSATGSNWYDQFDRRRLIADQPAKLALSLVDTDFDKATSLVIQSLQGGIFSRALLEIVEKLMQAGNRSALSRLEINIGQSLAANVALDPFSLANAATLVQTDKEMPQSARNAFVSFFLRSLQAWSSLVRNPQRGDSTETSYVSIVFTMFSLSVRPIILQYSPDQLLGFDVAMDQVAPLIPEATRARLEAFKPETLLDPRDRLNDILKDPNADRRDLRLVRLVSQLLRNESEDLQKNHGLAADAISGFSDADTKSTFTDLLTIAGINASVKQKKYVEAQRLAGSILSDETRAWALLALSTTAAKTDPVFRFELVNAGLKALDKVSPAPGKVELALTATAMFAETDIERAFEAFVVASRYSNSSVSRIDPPKKPPVAFGLDVSIGNEQTKLGVSAESLADLQIDQALGALGIADWFRANEIADRIKDRTLRLRLKLQFAEAMLARESKLKRDAPIPKAPG